MPADENLRHRLHLRLAELLDDQLADAMIESMAPMPRNQLVTKIDLATFAGRMDESFDRIDERFERIDERFERIDERFDRTDENWERRFAALTERFDALGTTVEAHMIGLEGRLSMRWMETTRIIVFSMMVLFVGVIGMAVALGAN